MLRVGFKNLTNSKISVKSKKNKFLKKRSFEVNRKFSKKINAQVVKNRI
jgi:hypothetical protein